MFALILDILLALLAVVMLVKGHFGVTRQAALCLLAVAALDASFYGLLSVSALSVVAIGLQLVMLAVGGQMLYQDGVRARNQRARRHRRQEIARSRAAFEQALDQRQSVASRRVCA